MTPEGKVKARVKATLKKYGVYFFMPVQNGYGAPGLDFHCAIKGKAFAIETKAPGGKLTPRQKMTVEEMEAAGVVVFVIGRFLLKEADTPQSRWQYSGETELEAWLLGLLS